MITLHTDCIPCALSGALRTLRAANASEDCERKAMREILKLVANTAWEHPAPLLGQAIQRLVRQACDHKDPYAELKALSTQVMLDLLPRLRTRTEQSTDRLRTAMTIAAAANRIDFGPSTFDPTVLEDLLCGSNAPEFSRDDYEELQRELAAATKVLLILDNAGEIVADRLLIEELGPDRVTAVVRGAPVLNDAIMEDARMAGLLGLCTVIDSGQDLPGTPYELEGDLAAAFDEADVIISKGQGNFETLEGRDSRVFFILMAKCPPVADCLGVETGQLVLARNGVTGGDTR